MRLKLIIKNLIKQIFKQNKSPENKIFSNLSNVNFNLIINLTILGAPFFGEYYDK